jgi:hypothetical protein
MSRCAGLDPVDGSWPPPGLVVVGSQIVVVVDPMVVGARVVEVVGTVVAGVVVVIELPGSVVVAGDRAVVGGAVVGGAVVAGGRVVEVVVIGSQIVVVVGAWMVEVGGGTVVGGTVVGGTVGGGAVGGSVVGGAVVGGAVVGGAVVGGWAVWRRTGAARATPALTGTHSLARRRPLAPLPFLQPLASVAHHLARRRSRAQLSVVHALVARRSLGHSPIFQALAVGCVWSLPVRRGLAAGMSAWLASAGAAISPATSRAPTTTASDDARRRGTLMLRFSMQWRTRRRGRQPSPMTSGSCSCAELLTVPWANRCRSSTFAAS